MAAPPTTWATTSWFSPGQAGPRVPAPGCAGARTELGLSQETLARRVGVWPADVSAWETNRHQAGARLRQELAGVLGIDPWATVEDQLRTSS